MREAKLRTGRVIRMFVRAMGQSWDAARSFPRGAGVTVGRRRRPRRVRVRWVNFLRNPIVHEMTAR